MDLDPYEIYIAEKHCRPESTADLVAFSRRLGGEPLSEEQAQQLFAQHGPPRRAKAAGGPPPFMVASTLVARDTRKKSTRSVRPSGHSAKSKALSGAGMSSSTRSIGGAGGSQRRIAARARARPSVEVSGMEPGRGGEMGGSSTEEDESDEEHSDLYEVGDRVQLTAKREGVIAFKGTVAFAKGVFYGIRLNRPVGVNDGSVDGTEYFKCPPMHGVFVTESKIICTLSKVGREEDSDDEDSDDGGIDPHISMTKFPLDLSDDTKEAASPPTRGASVTVSSMGIGGHKPIAGRQRRMKLREGPTVGRIKTGKKRSGAVSGGGVASPHRRVATTPDVLDKLSFEDRSQLAASIECHSEGEEDFLPESFKSRQWENNDLGSYPTRDKTSATLTEGFGRTAAAYGTGPVGHTAGVRSMTMLPTGPPPSKSSGMAKSTPLKTMDDMQTLKPASETGGRSRMRSFSSAFVNVGKSWFGGGSSSKASSKSSKRKKGAASKSSGSLKSKSKGGSSAAGSSPYRNPVFGVDTTKLECTPVPGYDSPIPAVLVALNDAFWLQHGHMEEGIFRIAPSADNCKDVKHQLNSDWKSVDLSRAPVHTVANLIKVWFRDLPEPVLQWVRPEVIEHTQTEAQCADLFLTGKFPEPQKSLLLWLLDLCVKVTVHDSVNKMNTTVEK